jgi:hypothetical protein
MSEDATLAPVEKNSGNSRPDTSNMDLGHLHYDVALGNAIAYLKKLSKKDWLSASRITHTVFSTNPLAAEELACSRDLARRTRSHQELLERLPLFTLSFPLWSRHLR